MMLFESHPMMTFFDCC